jgi:DNA-binding beta-propeller fold protein YncE
VTGNSVGSTASGDYTTVAYSASTGSQLWVGRYNGPANGEDSARAIAVSADGTRVFVTGTSYGSSTFDDFATVAYDAVTGSPLWVRRYNGPANGYDEAAPSIAVSRNGKSVFVTGAAVAATSTEYATIAYSTTAGTEQWVALWHRIGSDADVPTSLGVSPNGATVFVTGVSYGSTSGNNQDFATVAYRATTGRQLWVTRYNGPANLDDTAWSLGVSPDGKKVFVTGTTGDTYGDPTGVDFATVAYTSNKGAQLWASHYNGPANGDDNPWNLALSPDGSKVFVTGQSPGVGTNMDAATVAYIS